MECKPKKIYGYIIMGKTRKRSGRGNAWSKAAGEYWRAHKNDSDIEKFSDVLKSPKFRAYYNSKYGDGKSSAGLKKSKKNMKMDMEETETEKEEIEEDEMEEKMKPKRRNRKSRKQKRMMKEEEIQGDEKWSSDWAKEKSTGFNKDYFNGGKKEKEDEEE
jgi:hypothetical protein